MRLTSLNLDIPTALIAAAQTAFADMKEEGKDPSPSLRHKVRRVQSVNNFIHGKKAHFPSLASYDLEMERNVRLGIR